MRAVTNTILLIAFMTVAMVDPTCAYAAPSPSAQRDEQWLFRSTSRESGTRDLAIFLSWDYSDVIFRAWCEPPGTLVIQYFSEEAIDKTYRMRLELGSRTFAADRVSTTSEYADRRVLEGSFVLHPNLFSAVALADDVDIDVPNDMGEPFYTGRAAPLKRVVKSCRTGSQSRSATQ